VYRAGFVAWVTALIIVTSGAVRADSGLEEISRKIAEMSGSQPNGGVTAPQAAAQADKKLSAFEASLQRPAATSTPDPRFAIVSHFRATQGRPFPGKEAVVLAPRPTTVARGVSLPAADYWVAGQNRLARPAACAQMSTRKVQRRASGDSKVVIYDVLYVPQELVALDSSEVYGANTTVYGSQGVAGEDVLLRMSLDRVPCLPYRMRLTDTHLYLHTGEDALRNYDSDPFGPGVLHNWVRSHLKR
jgi:hypothetical protein